jgi:RNA polymerase sigma factor (sigma-70 family)
LDRSPERAARFRALYEAHVDVVHAYVLRRAEPGIDAADVVAETFTTLWRRLEDVPGDGTERGWLVRVAGYALANARRAQRRRGRLQERLQQLGQPAVAAGTAPAPADVAACRAAMGRLRPAERELLRLVVWDGLTQQEAAVALGCTTNAVALRLARVRRRLRRLLAEEGVGGTGQEAPGPGVLVKGRR